MRNLLHHVLLLATDQANNCLCAQRRSPRLLRLLLRALGCHSALQRSNNSRVDGTLLLLLSEPSRVDSDLLLLLLLLSGDNKGLSNSRWLHSGNESGEHAG